MIRTVKSNAGRSSRLTPLSSLNQKLTRGACKLAPGIASRFVSSGRYDLTICAEKKFLWYRVPKVCTQSIWTEIELNGIDLDAEEAYACHYAPPMYKDYFKFGFVRNPWDRLVSCWQNKVVEMNHFGFDDIALARMQDFECFVEYVEGIELHLCDGHINLQSNLIDLDHVDFIGRFESFDADLKQVFDRIGLNVLNTRNENPSGKKGYQDYYNSDLANRVGTKYEKDVRLFEYEFE